MEGKCPCLLENLTLTPWAPLQLTTVRGYDLVLSLQAQRAGRVKHVGVEVGLIIFNYSCLTIAFTVIPCITEVHERARLLRPLYSSGPSCKNSAKYWCNGGDSFRPNQGGEHGLWPCNEGPQSHLRAVVNCNSFRIVRAAGGSS